jgi:hypothetical protein
LPAACFFVTLTLPSPVKGEGYVIVKSTLYPEKWRHGTLSPRGRGQGEGVAEMRLVFLRVAQLEAGAEGMVRAFFDHMEPL